MHDFVFDTPVLWVKTGMQNETESLILDQMDRMWSSNYYNAIEINKLKPWQNQAGDKKQVSSLCPSLDMELYIKYVSNE